MDKPRPDDDSRMTASQLVAHNLTRARQLRGLTQAEVAERLARFTGARWSQATVAQAEGSVRGPRVRQFTATELVALARTFDLPVLYFFMPPDSGEGGLVTDDVPPGLAWEYLLALLLGHEGNFSLLAERTAGWAHVLNRSVRVPRSDVLAETTSTGDVRTADLWASRQPFLPEDVLAAAFHGLAARRVRGARRPGDDVTTFIANLRGLADAFEAFNNYRPGAFVDEGLVEEIAEQRREREGRLKEALEADDDE